MKKFLSIVSALSIAVAASAQDASKTTYVIDGSETLYIIDGVVSTQTAAKILSSDEIENMSIVKNISQAVIITTKGGRSVSGHVEGADGKPIQGALVQVEGMPVGTVTDRNGYYEITLPAGKTRLKFSFIDLQTRTVEAEAVNKSTIVLHPETGKSEVVRKHKAVISDRQPMIIIKNKEGKIYKADNMDSIKPENIKTLNIYKREQDMKQFEQYGDTSAGVIYIELK